MVCIVLLVQTDGNETPHPLASAWNLVISPGLLSQAALQWQHVLTRGLHGDYPFLLKLLESIIVCIYKKYMNVTLVCGLHLF